MIDGAKTVGLGMGDSSTACSASALERKKRVRWNAVAPTRREEEESLHPSPLGR